MKKPKKWWEVYPSGTKKGNEENKFFIALSRHPKYPWRSISALVTESGLSQERIEELLFKYLKKGLVFIDPNNPNKWGYWERVPDMLKDPININSLDKHKRIENSLKKDD